MIDLKKFRRVNNLTQAELGDYLGIKKSYMSLLESGTRPISNDKLSKLLENPYNWDTSMLMNEQRGTTMINAQAVGRGNATMHVGDDSSALRRENELLREQLAEEKRRSAQYWEMIQKIMK